MLQSLYLRISKNAFIRGGLIFTTASFLVSICHYLFNLVVARGFSFSIYGEYMSALSYFAVLSVPLSAFNVIVINRISKSQIKDRATVAKSIEQLLISTLLKYRWLLLIIFSLLFAFLYLKTNLLKTSILFILGMTTINIFFTFYSSVLQAYKTFFLLGVFALSMALVKVTVGAGIVFTIGSLDMLYIFLFVLTVTSVLIGSKLLRHKQSIRKKLVSFHSLQSYVLKKQVILPTLTMFGIIGMLNMDLIFVKKFFDADQAGLYAAISLMGKIILYATGPLSLVALTFFSGSENKQNKKKILFFTVILYILVGVVASIAYWLLSNSIVSIIFGQKYLEISKYIWLSAVFGSLYSVVNLFAQYAISSLKNFASYSLLGLVIQVLAFYFFHRSFYDVLVINSAVMVLMGTIYSIAIYKNAK